MSTQLMSEESNGGDTLSVQSAYGGAFKGMCIDLFVCNSDEGAGVRTTAEYRMDRCCAENLVKCIQAAYAEADARETERKKKELANKLVNALMVWDRENQCFSDNDLVDIPRIKSIIMKELTVEEAPF